MPWKVSADPVDFKEAIAWFRKRVAMTRGEYDAALKKARHQAFFVSGIAQLDLVSDAWRAVDAAVSKGTTLEEFKRSIGEQLRAAWGDTVDDPAWRLETIFRTNVQNAYATGRYKQATKPEVIDDRPVWMFDAILDGRETEICKACDGTKLPSDDEWWRTHLPPLHFNCRSSFVTLTEEQAGKLTDAKPNVIPPDGFGGVPDDGKTIAGLTAKKVTKAPKELAAARAEKTHDPAFWLSHYAAYGEAAETVAYGRAAMERGLDMPIGDVIQQLEKLESKESSLEHSGLRLAREAKRNRKKSLRELLHPDSSWSAESKANAQIASMLAGHAAQVTPPQQLEVTPTFPAKDAATAKLHLEQAKAFFGRLLSSTLEHKVNVTWLDDRAYYDAGTIFTDFRARTIAHEWGHQLEDHNPKLLDRAIAFLAERTKSDKVQRLSELMKNSAYQPHEVAKPDRFYSKYVGKLYLRHGKHWASEITSMGLEALFAYEQDAHVDLEHLMFTIGQLAHR